MIIATLIAAGRLDERLLNGALGRLPGAELRRWIDLGDAAEIQTGADRQLVQALLEGWENVDVVVHSPGKAEKKLLVADMDSTMIGQECIDELADYAGFRPEVAAITERAMRGELDFASALAERVALLERLPEKLIEICLAERISATPGAEVLVRTMRARGAMTLLVSGGFTAFVQPVAKRLGFERFEANVLEARQGKLTGRTVGRIVGAEFKRDILETTRKELGLSAEEVMAIGDGANDMGMVEAAGLGIAYRAKPALVAVADARIEHHGLDALLWAQGISSAEWVAV